MRSFLRFLGKLSLLVAVMFLLGSLFSQKNFLLEAFSALTVSFICFAILYRGWDRVGARIGGFFRRNIPRAWEFLTDDAIPFVINHWMGFWLGISAAGFLVSVIFSYGWIAILTCSISFVLALVTVLGQWGNVFQGLGQAGLWAMERLRMSTVFVLKHAGKALGGQYGAITLTGSWWIMLLAVGFLTGSQICLIVGWLSGIAFFFLIMSIPVRKLRGNS